MTMSLRFSDVSVLAARDLVKLLSVTRRRSYILLLMTSSADSAGKISLTRPLHYDY